MSGFDLGKSAASYPLANHYDSNFVKTNKRGYEYDDESPSASSDIPKYSAYQNSRFYDAKSGKMDEKENSRNAFKSSGRPILEPISRSGSGADALSAKNGAILANLRATARLLDQHLINDQLNGNLYEQLENSASNSSSDYTRQKIPTFIKKRFFSIPKPIQEQVDLKFSQIQSEGKKVAAFVGVLVEIKYAWISVDSSLYLWNLEEGNDFVSFEELSDPITKVSLAAVKDDVFVKDIRHILVVATPTEVVLLGVSFESAASASTASKESFLRLRNTGFKMSLGGSFFVCAIQSTPSGRIFLAGDDGQLYEVTYEKQERWFKKNCDIKDCTSNWLRKILPARTKDSKITFLAFEEDRNILYAANSKSEIKVFSLGSEGDDFFSVGKIENLPDQLCKFSSSYSVPKDEFQIIHMATVSSQQSPSVCLVAVTADGDRIFFGLKEEAREKDTNFSIFISHIRFSAEETSIKLKSFAAKKYSRACLADDVTILCNGGFTEESLMLQTASVNYPRLIGKSSVIPYETWSDLRVDDEVLAVVPFSSLKLDERELCNRLVHLNNFHPSNELLTQHFGAFKEFLLISNSGIDLIRKNRSIDVLQSLIAESRGHITDSIRSFFDSFKLEQSCAMCIALACETFAGRANSRTAIDADVCTWTMSVVSRFGGEPVIVENRKAAAGFAAGSGGPYLDDDIGYGLATTEVSFSFLHKGLCLYLARVLRPILKSKLSLFAASHENIVHNSKLFLFVVKQLQTLKLLINANASIFFKDTSYSMAGMRQKEHASKNEKESYFQILKFIDRFIEAVNFYLFIIDYGSVELSRDMSSLFDISFESFVTTTKGIEISREVTNIIIQKEIKADRSIAAMCESLKTKCPNFFGSNDIMFYRASECLYRAKITKSIREREEMLVEATRYFADASEFIEIAKFAEIAEAYISLGYHAGVIKLGIAVAASIDPEQLGFAYLKSGKEISEYAEHYQKKCAIYEVMFSAFDDMYALDASKSQNNSLLFFKLGSSAKKAVDYQAMAHQNAHLCFRIEDSLLHWKLLEYFVKKGKYSIVMSADCAETEEFLIELFKQCIKGVGYKEQTDLLWKFYIEKRKGKEASQILYTLSECTKPDLLISHKVEYLTVAIATAKTMIEEVGQRDVIVRDIDEQLDVARIQLEIISLIKAKYGEMHQESIDDLNHSILDLTTLYNKYAKALKIPEAALLIFKSANYDNMTVLTSTWQEIIDRDVLNDSSLSCLKSSLVYLSKLLYPSEKVFPLHFIVSALAKMCLERSLNRWLVDVFSATIVPLNMLFSELERLFYQKNGTWASEQGKLFLFHNISQILSLACTDSGVRNALFSVKNIQNIMAELMSAASSIKRIDPSLYSEAEISYRKLSVLKK